MTINKFMTAEAAVRIIKDGDTVEVGATAGVLTFNGVAVGGRPVDPKVVSLH